MTADKVEAQARELARVMIDSGRPFEWTLVVLSAYFGRDVALEVIEGLAPSLD